jgi:putative NADH-flavin reductase
MRLAVFGATGRTGDAIVRQGRAAGHEIHALMRSPGRLEVEDVTIGDVRDQAAVERVVAGADAVVSAVGGTRPGNLAVLEHGTASILLAAERHRVSRLIVIQGFHLPFSGDPRGLGRPLVAMMLRAWNRHLSADTYRMAEVLRASELDWTLIRMPRLIAGPPGEGYRVGRLALGPWSTVTTGQVAHFTLTCLDRGTFVRDAPMIATARPAAPEPERADLEQPLPTPTKEL